MCGEFLYRKYKLKHITAHGLNLLEYKKLVNKDRQQKIQAIRSSAEHRKMTSNISRQQWSSYDEHKKKERINKTKLGMQQSEKYQNRDFSFMKSEFGRKQHTEIMIKQWASRTQEQVDAISSKIVATRRFRDNFIPSVSQRQKMSDSKKQHYIDNPQAKLKFVLAGAKSSGRTMHTGSKAELIVKQFLKNNNITNFLHSGDGKHHININGKIYIPDFIDVEHKKIIEVNGCYFHGCPKCKPQEIKRYVKSNNKMQDLRDAGYKVAEIWEHELETTISGWQRRITNINQMSRI